LTIAATLAVRWRFGPVAAVILGALTVPTVMAALAYWVVTRPNPRHVDGPGMLMAAIVTMEPFAILIGLVVSLLTVLVQTRLRASDNRSARQPPGTQHFRRDERSFARVNLRSARPASL
jgi:hypothetical protein